MELPKLRTAAIGRRRHPTFGPLQAYRFFKKEMCKARGKPLIGTQLIV
jgi:hypothetical protein